MWPAAPGYAVQVFSRACAAPIIGGFNFLSFGGRLRGFYVLLTTQPMESRLAGPLALKCSVVLPRDGTLEVRSNEKHS